MKYIIGVTFLLISQVFFTVSAEEFVLANIQYDNNLYMLKYNKETQTQDIIFWKFTDGGTLLPPAFVDDNCLYVLVSPEYIEATVSMQLLTDESKILLESIREDER